MSLVRILLGLFCEIFVYSFAFHFAKSAFLLCIQMTQENYCIHQMYVSNSHRIKTFIMNTFFKKFIYEILNEFKTAHFEFHVRQERKCWIGWLHELGDLDAATPF